MESGTFYLLRVLRCRVFIVVRLQRLRHRTEACHESLVAGSGTDVPAQKNLAERIRAVRSPVMAR
jgi:hypothetical protein